MGLNMAIGELDVQAAPGFTSAALRSMVPSAARTSVKPRANTL